MNKKQDYVRNFNLIDVSESFSFNFLIPETKHTLSWIKKPFLALSPVKKEELNLLMTITQGDENGFTEMIDRYHSAILRFAWTFGREEIEVEKVVVDTWEDILQQLHQFKGQYSLKIWIFEILIKRARSHFGQTPNPNRSYWLGANILANFLKQSGKKGSNKNSHSGFFGSRKFSNQDQKRLSAKKVMPEDLSEKMKMALDQLPLRQKQVMYLRDVERFTSDEVFHLLQIDGSHQVKLLHKARETMRKVLDEAIGSIEIEL